MTMTKTTVTVTRVDPWREMGGGCYRDYWCEVASDGVTASARGWAVGAFLRPGQSTGLDGSALPADADGWITADADGHSLGRPTATADRGEPGAVTVRTDTHPGVQIATPDGWDDEDYARELDAEIQAAVESSGVHDAPDDADVYADLPEIPEAAIRIGDWRGAGLVLARLDDDGHHVVSWPTADDVLDVLDVLRGTTSDPDLRALADDICAAHLMTDD